MPPYQGGGEMILNVDYSQDARGSTRRTGSRPARRTSPAPSACTPRMDYLDAIGRDNIFAARPGTGAYAYEKLAALKGIRLFGPHNRPRRPGQFSAERRPRARRGDAWPTSAAWRLRGGHHCNQPLMKKLGVESTARASFYFYNTTGRNRPLRRSGPRNPEILRSLK